MPRRYQIFNVEPMDIWRRLADVILDIEKWVKWWRYTDLSFSISNQSQSGDVFMLSDFRFESNRLQFLDGQHWDADN